MKPITKTVESREEYYLTFSDEEIAELGWERGDKFTVKEQNGAIVLEKYAELELNMDEWDRATLEYLIKESCDKDISVNEVISEVLEGAVEYAEELVNKDQYDFYDITTVEYKKLVNNGEFWELYPNATGDWWKDSVAYNNYVERIEEKYGVNNPNYTPLLMKNWLKYARKCDFDLEKDLHEWNKDKRADSEN